jgi:hypothetical protein
MKIDPNEPAFPSYSDQCGPAHGMTIRTEIASRILAGFMASQIYRGSPEETACAAIECADALIAELNKEQPE